MLPDGYCLTLASRSPRRLELLSQLFGRDRIRVQPPESPLEAGFDGCTDWPSIDSRLQQIAQAKRDEILAAANAASPGHPPGGQIVVAADSIIVVGDNKTGMVVLGQPPEQAWADCVRDWFRRYLCGRTHVAATALSLATASGQTADYIAKTKVTFHDDADRWIEWYIDTGEPRGKAGGYAIQGAGSIFVSGVEGSLSNVVGLPQRELLQMLPQLVAQD